MAQEAGGVGSVERGASAERAGERVDLRGGGQTPFESIRNVCVRTAFRRGQLSDGDRECSGLLLADLVQLENAKWIQSVPVPGRLQRRRSVAQFYNLFSSRILK